MHVVFVDGNAESRARVTAGLAAAQGGWDLTCVANGSEAMAAFDGGNVDVVVADMCAAHPDGAQLLRRVRTAHPETMRLLVTDARDRGSSMMALDIAQQCVARPCDVDDVIEAIERLATLRRTLESQALRWVVGQVERLPSAPRTYMQLRGLLGDPECHGRAVADLLRQDPALTTKTLQVANSAFFNCGSPIADIPSAIMRIGLDALRLIVLANEVFDAHRGEAAVALRDRAVRASVIAAHIADVGMREVARTAALLADVGLLIPGVEALCAAQAGRSGMAPTHAEVGAYLLGLWGLPMMIVEAVAYHHAPARAGRASFDMLGVVHVAVALAHGHEPDTDYLRSVGMEMHLPAWRRMVEKIDERGNDTRD